MTTHHQQTFHIRHIRTYGRVPVQGTVELLNDRLHVTGHVWNLSVHGCRVDGNRELLPGTVLSLLLSLSGTDDYLIVDVAIVAWTRGAECGLYFKNMDASHAARLQQIVRDYGCHTATTHQTPPSDADPLF